jgi:heme ABC exporter ATP-binding subunit CcmA
LRITLRKLAKAYGFRWALRDLNLELAPGDFVALLGPNGAGKTTLLKLLAGLTLPTHGTVDFDGAAKAPNDPRRRQQIGLLAPADHLYDNLTVKENLSFFCRLYGKGGATEGIDNALEDVSLLKRADEFVANLSSGMRCRLSIAKWQLLEPGLLLLDEPYGVLDGSGVNLLETFLTKHCTQGNIVILASHHVSRVLQLCSRAVILHQGRLTFNEPRQHPWPTFDAAFGEFLPHSETWSS